jgi:hypothetical protein
MCGPPDGLNVSSALGNTGARPAKRVASCFEYPNCNAAGAETVQETPMWQALNDSGGDRLCRSTLKHGIICKGIKEMPGWRRDLQPP